MKFYLIFGSVCVMVVEYSNESSLLVRELSLHAYFRLFENAC